MSADEAADKARRSMAISLYNQAWDILDSDDRSPEALNELIDCAHASRHLWRGVGGIEQAAIGEWLVSRSYATAGLGAEAVRHAALALQLAESSADRADWLLPSALEGMTRAELIANGPEAANMWHARALIALESIADPEDRALIQAQLDELGL